MSASRVVLTGVRLALTLLIGAAAALWPAADATAQALVVGANFVIKSLDPARTVETTSNMVNHSVYDSLVTFDGEDLTTPKPSLATDWTVSPDGKTYTFRLRRNVRFASGNPLTSADVKWSLDRVRYLKSNPAFFLNSVEDIQAPDPFTVVLKLKAPNPALLPILSSSSLGAVDSRVHLVPQLLDLQLRHLPAHRRVVGDEHATERTRTPFLERVSRDETWGPGG